MCINSMLYIIKGSVLAVLYHGYNIYSLNYYYDLLTTEVMAELGLSDVEDVSELDDFSKNSSDNQMAKGGRILNKISTSANSKKQTEDDDDDDDDDWDSDMTPLSDSHHKVDEPVAPSENKGMTKMPLSARVGLLDDIVCIDKNLINIGNYLLFFTFFNEFQPTNIFKYIQHIHSYL